MEWWAAGLEVLLALDAPGKVLNLGHQKVSPTKARRVMPWERQLLFLQEMWEPLPDPAV